MEEKVMVIYNRANSSAGQYRVEEQSNAEPEVDDDMPTVEDVEE